MSCLRRNVMVLRSCNAQVHALVLTAGLGTRLLPLTRTTPKSLLPIGGRPLLDYWMDRLAAAGISNVLINTHHLPEQVRGYIARVNREGHAGTRFNLRETHEPDLLGSAGTVTANRQLADDASEIVIIYSDNLSSADLAAMLDFHRSHGDPMTMLLFRAAEPERCGIAEVDAEMRVVGFQEKPSHPRSSLANGGVYVVEADAYREIADLRAHDIGFDVLPRFVGRMRGWEWTDYHVDIGTHGSLAQANADVERGAMKLGWSRT